MTPPSRSARLLGGLLAGSMGLVAARQARSADSPPDAAVAARQAFAQVASVLLSPRCRNCHPVGDAPLQGDLPRPHVMNISRASAESGLACDSCHQTRNSEAVGVRGGPPGAPKWALPPRKTPMVFEGRSASALCEQLKDPGQNGERTLQALLDHVSHDPLVLWGWSPGGTRSLPPLSHERFVAAFSTWVAGNGACP